MTRTQEEWEEITKKERGENKQFEQGSAAAAAFKAQFEPEAGNALVASGVCLLFLVVGASVFKSSSGGGGGILLVIAAIIAGRTGHWKWNLQPRMREFMIPAV
jgi:hypothetical protein